MFGLNTVLQSTGVDLNRTRLVRHRDDRGSSSRSPYGLWIAGDGRFEMYQRIQGKHRFKDADHLVSFVATPLDETLFVGVYRVKGVGTVPAGTTDPVGGHDVTGFYFYDLELEETLRDYINRIIIEWGPAYRAWVQRADRRDKKILEIRRAAVDPPFPGFTSFSWPIRELSTVPHSWRSTLSTVGGVYVLACRATGKLYVGSASGAEGFWSRWESYFRTGHGGNEGMKLAAGHDYQVSILEFASSSLSRDEVIRMEERWKEKLLTRRFGFN